MVKISQEMFINTLADGLVNLSTGKVHCLSEKMNWQEEFRP
jgi:hypothetical protein